MAANESDVNQILQKGIRAARRGYKPQAQQLLSQVLQQDPNNEQAWMWLYQVVDSSSQKRECVQRVLSINPESQWAAYARGQLSQERLLRLENELELKRLEEGR